jgi:hypothetical protein
MAREDIVTMSPEALPPEMAAMLRAIREARPCEQASYVHLDDRARATVDALIARGLVKIENAIPRPTEKAS